MSRDCTTITPRSTRAAALGQTTRLNGAKCRIPPSAANVSLTQSLAETLAHFLCQLQSSPTSKYMRGRVDSRQLIYCKTA